jgi:hypothetical protein
MRIQHAHAAAILQAFAVAVFIGSMLPTAATAADEPAVIAVVAVDPYADLKKQAKWVGAQVDQPTLDGFLESFIMIGTQFKGLAGLDVNRPAGVVVTAEGPAGVPVPRGFVPVKDLGKLLEALQGIIGPAQEQDGVRTISPPGMPAIQIVEKDGWAIFSPQGSPDAAAGLEQALDPVVNAFSLGVQVFPARMPEDMRKQLETLLQQAAAMQAQQGQPVDADALKAGLENLADVETILLGANIDVDKERVYLENRFAMVPGSAAGNLYGEMAKAVLSTPAVATADGKPAAVSGHAAVAIPESLREAAKAFLVQALPVSNRVERPDGFSETTVFEPANTVFTLVRQVVPAMLDAGGIDAALTVDTAAAEMAAGKALPAVTAGLKVKDGRALEADLKAAIGAKGALPEGVSVKFDAGKAGAANLHVIEIDMAGNEEDLRRVLGEKLSMTLAVTPAHAFVVLGGDVEKRITAATAGAVAKPDAKPLAGLDVSLAPLVAYAAGTQKFVAPDDADGIAMAKAANDEAAALPSSLVQVLVRPIERGMATRLSADGGAIKVLKTLFEMRSGSPAVQPQPAGFGPRPVPKGQPIPLPGLAP